METVFKCIYKDMTAMDSNIEKIAGVLLKQAKFNKWVGLFAITSAMVSTMLYTELRKQEKEINNLKAEIEEMKKTEG